MENPLDLATTRFLLPPDARLIAVNELAPRLRESLGAVDGDEVVVTRPGFRVTARQVAPPLAALLSEFRTASRITDAVHRFSRSHGQDPQAVLDHSFDALLACITGRILVDAASSDTHAAAPSLASGQAFAGMEVEALIRALDDTEVYRVRWMDGKGAALKLARDGRAAATLAHEADLLEELNGGDTPHLLGHGAEGERAWLAVEWRDGVPVSVAAQQARAAGSRRGLATIVGGLLAAYARLHARGIVHGDIHTGNILVEDDGRITLIDFGRASRVGGSQTDLRRAGIPHFYDPEMAAAILAGALPPAVTPLSEQHALAMLAYLLLTGLYGVDPPAEQRELLTRIVARPPLPFVARGVAAWPRVETVLSRALAKQPAQRFQTTSSFARAFDAAARTDVIPAPPFTRIQAILEDLRSGESLPSFNARAQAWLSLRAALAWSDEVLLAAADVAIARADAGWEAKAVAAQIGRARSDRIDEQAAIDGFVEAAARAAPMTSRCQALVVAAQLLHGADSRGLATQPLRRWAAVTLLDLWPTASPDVLHAGLALEFAGAVRLPPDARARLDALKSGSAWLWALAHDLFADPAYAARAKASTRPAAPLLRGLRQLRLYQLTGADRWLASARRAAVIPADQPLEVASALIAIELEAPARSVLPPWRLLPEERGKHSPPKPHG